MCQSGHSNGVGRDARFVPLVNYRDRSGQEERSAEKVNDIGQWFLETFRDRVHNALMITADRGGTVAYIRVSSRAQDHASQRDAIERAAAARGDTITTWYAEKKSAKTMARPELQRLRADAQAGRVARVYVFRLDRLTRTGIRDTLEVVEEFRDRCKVDVVSVADGFDLNGPCAEVVIAVMAWAAKMELLAKNERIAAARDLAEAEGRAWGRPSKMTAAQLDTARRMKSEGKSVRTIAQAIGISKTIVGRAVAAKAVATV